MKTDLLTGRLGDWLVTWWTVPGDDRETDRKTERQRETDRVNDEDQAKEGGGGKDKKKEI